MYIELKEIKKWHKLRTSLSQDYTYNNDWETAIELFDKRLKRKFFNPVQLIINEQKLEGEGFTILTVQCSLIEMLSSFRKGEIFNHKKKATSPAYEYSESRKMFVDFLKSASIFKDIFWESADDKDENLTTALFDPEDFYSSVRCGLMHEARTKNNWFINAAPRTLKVKTEKNFLQHKGDKKIIYRTILHHRLLTYLSDYNNELRQENKDGKKLRKFFARKLDHLFEIAQDKKFDWWNE